MADKPTYEEFEKRVKELEEEAVKLRQTKEALRSSEDRLALALEATSDGIWDWDIIKGQTYASQRCSEILGIRKDNESPRPSETWASRIHPDDYDRVSQCLHEHLDGKAPYDVEYRHLHENGEYRWQRSRGMALFDEKGAAYRMVGSIRDITDRKLAEQETARLEAQLQQAKKMEALGTLAGGVAHDFNNLLTAILGNIELSQMYARQEEQINRNLNKAKKACKRAKDLTRQIITFANGGDPVKKTGSLIKMIQDCAKFALSGSDTYCAVSLPDNLWQVDFDVEQMRQVISNLIINASEAMGEEGTIEIRAENVDPGAQVPDNLQGGKQVRISVRDHGGGIPQEVLDKIFVPYFSSKEMVTQKGLGLGLSICYSITYKHGGHIEVESKIGTGTTFHIYLPASEE